LSKNFHLEKNWPRSGLNAENIGSAEPELFQESAGDIAGLGSILSNDGFDNYRHHTKLKRQSGMRSREAHARRSKLLFSEHLHAIK
jgi:hypothetical protein